MSNCTNLTLSATTNRLNLGSRSLVLVTSQNDKATLNFRHAVESHPGITARPEPMIMQPPVDMSPAYQPSFKADGKRGTKPAGGKCSTLGSASGSTSWLLHTWRELIESTTQGCLSLEAPPRHLPVVVPDVPSSVRPVSRPRMLESAARPRLYAPARATGRADLASRSVRSIATALAPAAAS